MTRTAKDYLAMTDEVRAAYSALRRIRGIVDGPAPGPHFEDVADLAQRCEAHAGRLFVREAREARDA